jgi:hypothetical protein
VSFSNPAANAAASAKACVQALLGVLGDRQPLDVARWSSVSERG